MYLFTKRPTRILTCKFLLAVAVDSFGKPVPFDIGAILLTPLLVGMYDCRGWCGLTPSWKEKPTHNLQTLSFF